MISHSCQRYCLAARGKAAQPRRVIAELREIVNGHDDILAEAAGITAGSWYAWPSTHVGHELIAAGMLIMAAQRHAVGL